VNNSPKVVVRESGTTGVRCSHESNALTIPLPGHTVRLVDRVRGV